MRVLPGVGLGLTVFQPREGVVMLRRALLPRIDPKRGTTRTRLDGRAVDRPPMIQRLTDVDPPLRGGW